MNKTDVVDLCTFLQGMQTPSGPKSIPSVLHALTRRATGSNQPRDVIDDVVQDFALKLHVATRKGSPGGAQALLDLDDNRLAAVLVHRLRQVGLQSFETWGLLKSLRSHVRAVLQMGVEPGAEMPAKLTGNSGRICRALVAQATSALMTAGIAGSVLAIADQLMAQFFGDAHEHAADNLHTDVPTVEEQVVEHLDACIHAKQVVQVLGAQTAVMLARRSTGTTLGTLGKEVGQAVSTLHGHLAAPHSQMRHLCQRSGVSRNTHAQAMRLLASGVGR